MALDVDGVIDRRIFGFPATTAAGITALAQLAAAGFTVTLNTARSAREVRDYCAAYGLAGGVAEGGAYAWDAVAGRGRVLLDDAALAQLVELRAALAGLPGVFLDSRHEFTIRAFTYTRKGMAPPPALMVRNLIAARKLDRLSCYQTNLDTTVVARAANKGSGLAALLDWTGMSQAETFAVGDSETDLAMFRVAGRAFAPAHIDCPNLAHATGCAIAQNSFQRGLLEIVRRVAGSGHFVVPPAEDLFWELLQAADRPRAANLWRAFRAGHARRIIVK